ncbi:endo-1,4-beta-xylanase, partial [Aegicerativicinus sediminis]
LRQSESHKDNLTNTVSIGSDWKEYHIPFQANRNISKNDFRVVFQYGFKPQSLEMKDLTFEVFPMGTPLDALPKTETSYVGMEPNAQWRLNAISRIENLRKKDFILKFVSDGKPLVNQPFSISLKNHSFPFGAAINAKDVVEGNMKYNLFKENFNLAVFENDLKIKSWYRGKNAETTKKAMEILKSDGIDLKGHVLIWPGFNYLTNEYRQQKNNPEAIKSLMGEHVQTMLVETKGYTTQWDVVNEAYTNQDLQNITGSEEILFDGFKMAKKLQPSSARFTNEYGIISKGGIDSKKQEWYYNFIKRIDENTGGLVDGIGIQCHIGSDLTSPERVLKILTYYGSLGKKISISEFTMDIQDPQLREQYTRDFMIAAFSHPNVSEFLFWGYMEEESKKVDIFKSNGEIGSMGKAYFGLVKGAWHTKFNASTDNQGYIKNRGFFGTYEYQTVVDGQLKTGTFTLGKDQNSIITINLE